MHPEHHQARRAARAEALQRQYGKSEEVVYTDAADYARYKVKAAVTATPHSLLSSLTLRKATTLQAEETAIALAIAQTRASTIITDCQAAYRNYAAGRISTIALGIILQHPPRRNIRIIWTPAHSSLCGNQAAHAFARDLVSRAPLEEEERTIYPLLTYKDITQHYRLGRMRYPPVSEQLTRPQQTALRQLQTNTYPHPTRLHAIHPTLYDPLCRHCGVPATLYHMVWECQVNPHIDPIPNPSREQWERELASSCPSRQLQLIERAKTAGCSNGALD